MPPLLVYVFLLCLLLYAGVAAYELIAERFTAARCIETVVPIGMIAALLAWVGLPDPSQVFAQGQIAKPVLVLAVSAAFGIASRTLWPFSPERLWLASLKPLLLAPLIIVPFAASGGIGGDTDRAGRGVQTESTRPITAKPAPPTSTATGQLADAGPGGSIGNDPARVQALRNRLRAARAIDFQTDQAMLDEAGAGTVRDWAAYLRRNPGVTVIIRGYSRVEGSAGYNADLALRIARTVRAAFLVEGVDPDRIDMRSDASSFTISSQPIQPVRRAEIMIESTPTVQVR